MSCVSTNSYSKQSSHQDAYNPAIKAEALIRNPHRLQNIAKIKAKHRQQEDARLLHTSIEKLPESPAHDRPLKNPDQVENPA